MPDLRDVELRIAVAEGVLSRAEADALAEEARRKKQSPLALLVERGRLSEDSFQSFLAEALNDPAWRAAGKDASASTYTMQAMPRPSDEPAFPVAAWDRYVNVRFLGQGGMGMVFLAIDTRLRREVAIKFVRGDNADHVRRLIAEARTQARVSHDRICRVYEVGEVEGKVYIAMQYIEGTPLGRLAGELTLEQKAMLVRSAAEGIHEAHRAGIIHRDIKPSNIMVERGDDGELRPFVMDFGLARSAQEAGTTQTGAVLGTPRYMAPEQAQGDAAKLDRRADVYSLGATLYHLVTGEPAVPGDTIAEVIHNLITAEPRPLRAIDPSIPIDLEAIVLKCLEKERAARYDSARALADDLDRFLNGEPVLARPADTWYRLRKRLAKHRRLVVAAGTALLALIIAIGWAVKTSGQAAERERLARRFTEQVGGIESTALNSALSRLHDVRRDRTELRNRMDELAAEIRNAGDLAVGPGHYALGRGYLALGADEQARIELEVAWQAGFQEPRAAYALALAYGHLYQQGLLAAERIEDKEQREASRREVIERYRKPALGHLAHTETETANLAPRGYVAALTAFYKGDLDAALAGADHVEGAPAWFYELAKLRGDILFARAVQWREASKRDLARTDLAAGRAAYAAAAATGESVPALHESIGELEHVAMEIELYSDGDAVEPANRALAAVARALAVDPDHYETLVLEARVRRSLAEHQGNKGGNVEDLLRKALGGARRAAQLAPKRSEAQVEIARIYRDWAHDRGERGEDPSEQAGLAVAASDAVESASRDAEYYNNLAAAFSIWADYEDQRGANSQAHRSRAIDAFNRALRDAEANHRRDQQRDISINIALNLSQRAVAPGAADPDADLQQALVALGSARAIDPKHYVTYYQEGQTYEQIAQRARARGGDAGPALEHALAAYRRGLDVNRGIPYLHNGVGAVLQAQANAAWDRGEDPAHLLDLSQAAFEQAIAAGPEQGFGYGNAGEVYIQRAGFQRARDEDPGANASAAVVRLRQAIEKAPSVSTFHADLAMAYTTVAGYELEHGRDPRPNLDLAAAALASGLKVNANDAQIQLYVAETLGLRARLAARDGGGKAADFERAAHAFEQALALSPDSQDAALVFGRFCRAWSAFLRDAGADPEPALARGIALADQVLTRHDGVPDALALRASLFLIRAQHVRDQAERRALAERARQDFTRALSANAAFARPWATQVALALRLAASR